MTVYRATLCGTGPVSVRCVCHKLFRRDLSCLSIGVNTAGDTSSAMFVQPGTKYLISPAAFVKFLLSHAKRHCG